MSGALAAIAPAYRAVNVSSSALGTTWFTRPIRSASAAVYGRAVKKISAAADGPTRRTRRSTPLKWYPRPSRAAGSASRASSAAIRRSAQAASASPPPTHAPWIIATTGCSTASSASKARAVVSS